MAELETIRASQIRPSPPGTVHPPDVMHIADIPVVYPSASWLPANCETSPHQWRGGRSVGKLYREKALTDTAILCVHVSSRTQHVSPSRASLPARSSTAAPRAIFRFVFKRGAHISPPRHLRARRILEGVCAQTQGVCIIAPFAGSVEQGTAVGQSAAVTQRPVGGAFPAS
jgi:hypothetical protein